MAKLSTSEESDLLYLIHDKEHLGGSGANIPGVNAALRKLSSTAPTVYRGVSRAELAAIEKSPEHFVPRGYTSATEDVSVARKFARNYGTNAVLVMEGFRGFCYWRWLVGWFEDVKNADPDEYDSTDGDYMIESAQKEKEWLFGRTAYHVESRTKSGQFEFVTVRQGTVLSAAVASLRSLLVSSAWKDKTPAERRRYLKEHPLSPHNPLNLRKAHKIGVYRDSHAERRDYHGRMHDANPTGKHGAARDHYSASADAFGRAHDAYFSGDMKGGDDLTRTAMKLGRTSTKFASKNGILPPDTARGPAKTQKKSAKIRAEDAWRDYQSTLDAKRTADNFGVSPNSVKNALNRVPEYKRLAQQVKHVTMGRIPSDPHPAIKQALEADPSYLGSKKRRSSTDDAVAKKKDSLRKRGFVVPDADTISKIVPLLHSGHTVPQAARALGINKISVTHFGKKHLGEEEFRKLAQKNHDSQKAVRHGVSTKKIVRPGTSGNRKFSGPTDAKVWKSLKSALLAKETFDEKDHPRRADGEFAPKNGSSSAPVKKTRAHALSAAPEDREKWPEHIKALKLPPAWTSVRYSEDPHADLQAIGKDGKGRDQYVYHEKFAQSQAALKFARIHELDSKFDAIRDQVAKARKSKDPAVRDVADCVHLIMSTGLRPGGEDDTKADKKAYGASTLEGRHVVVKKGETRLRFVGKKGVDVDVPVEDPEAAALLRKRAKEAGESGQLFPRASASALLDFVHGLDGGSFKTKDMRTLKGTRTARELVENMDPPKNEREYRKAVMAVAKHVSSVLGNTPSVALAAYISPVVFAEWNTRMPGGASKEEASSSKKPLPNVRFGAKGLPDWRGAKKYAGRDDDEPRPTPSSVKRLLGFDPHAVGRKSKEMSAIVGRPNHHGDVHAELVRLVSSIKRWAHGKLGNDPHYLDRRDLDGNLSVICGDHHYSSLMIKLTSDRSPTGSYAVAKQVGGMTYIVMYACTSSVYEKYQPEFYESPVFTELMAHELTHQLQNLNDAHLLIGNRVRPSKDDSYHDYANSVVELQAWTMGAITRFTQHSKVRGVDAFWKWAEKQNLYGSWMKHATPASMTVARRIVEEVLGKK